MNFFQMDSHSPVELSLFACELRQVAMRSSTLDREALPWTEKKRFTCDIEIENCYLVDTFCWLLSELRSGYAQMGEDRRSMDCVVWVRRSRPMCFRSSELVEVVPVTSRPSDKTRTCKERLLVLSFRTEHFCWLLSELWNCYLWIVWYGCVATTSRQRW